MAFHQLTNSGKIFQALLAAYFALRGHHVYYVFRENTTITAMAAFVHRLLPSAADDAAPVAIGCSRAPSCVPRSHPTRCAGLRPQSHNLERATRPRHHRAAPSTVPTQAPLAKAVDYAEIFICDEAQP